MYKYICKYCNKEFEVTSEQNTHIKYKIKHKINYSGPFCSQKCAKNAIAANKKTKKSLYNKNYITYKHICPTCNKEFEVNINRENVINYNKKHNLKYRGPFCCRKCAIKYKNNINHIVYCKNCEIEIKMNSKQFTNYNYIKKHNPNYKGPFCSIKCQHNYYNKLRKEDTIYYSFIINDINCLYPYIGWKIKKQPYSDHNKKYNNGYHPRIYIQLEDPQKNIHTISYHKYLMEIYLKRFLLKNETVDHIDYDAWNNDISNLQVLNRKEHAKLDMIRLKPQKFICPECGTEIELSGIKLEHAIQKQKNMIKNNQIYLGPHCSISCGKKHNEEVKSGLKPNVPFPEIIPEYTTLKIEQMHLDKNKPSIKHYLERMSRKRNEK